VGIRQAEDLSRFLFSEKVDFIISSPLIRALTTAEIVNANRNIPVVIDRNLRERSFGVFEGGPRKTYQDALAASGMARWVYKPDGGESIPEVNARSENAFKAATQYRANTVLICAHEAVNRCLILMLLKRSIEEWTSIEQENCCINEFTLDENGTVSSFVLNKTDHLSEYA
jgi:broad specificity phosphatase PhoE